MTTLPDTSKLTTGGRLPADRHPAAVYLASLSKGSLPAQRSALRKIAELLGIEAEAMNWGALRYQHVQFIRARLAESYSAATANRLLTALRRVLREAWLLGYMGEDDYRKLAEVDRVRVERDDTEAELTGRALTIGELTAVMAACADDPTPAGARDAAVIALGYGLGLRRVEIARAKLADYDGEKGLVRVKHGKGNKSRILPIDNGARDALEAWLQIRGDAPGALFYGVNKGGRIHSRAINSRAVHELFAKRGEQAGVKDAGFHDLRRTFISDLLDKGVDVATVAKLAGHNDPATTLRYDRRKLESRREAIKSLHVPFVRQNKKPRKVTTSRGQRGKGHA